MIIKKVIKEERTVAVHINEFPSFLKTSYEFFKIISEKTLIKVDPDSGFTSVIKSAPHAFMNSLEKAEPCTGFEFDAALATALANITETEKVTA